MRRHWWSVLVGEYRNLLFIFAHSPISVTLEAKWSCDWHRCRLHARGAHYRGVEKTRVRMSDLFDACANHNGLCRLIGILHKRREYISTRWWSNCDKRATKIYTCPRICSRWLVQTHADWLAQNNNGVTHCSNKVFGDSSLPNFRHRYWLIQCCIRPRYCGASQVRSLFCIKGGSLVITFMFWMDRKLATGGSHHCICATWIAAEEGDKKRQ